MYGLGIDVSDVVLTVENLWKRYGSVVAVRGLTFQVRRGEVVALVGPNGAGKTTTLRCIMGLVSFNAGRISILGYDVVRERVKALKHVGYVPDNPVLYSGLTVLEHVVLSAVLHGMNEREALEEAKVVLEKLGIWDLRNQKASSLSRGQLQKTVIAMAFVHKPKLLIMDEPYAALDVEAQYTLKKMIRSYVEEGGAVLLTSHVMPWVEDIADRVIVIHKGVKIAEGSVEEVKKTLGGKTLEEALIKVIRGG